MKLAVAEDEALDALVKELASTSGAIGDHVEETLLRMIPEVRGDVREAMIRVLAERGLLRRSLERIDSQSAIQRAAAAELLGILGGSEVLGPLTDALRDRSLEVRLVAARALGVAAHPEAGGHLVDALSLTSGIPHSVAATALLSRPPAPSPSSPAHPARRRPSGRQPGKRSRRCPAPKPVRCAGEFWSMPMQMSAASSWTHRSPGGQRARSAEVGAPVAL